MSSSTRRQVNDHMPPDLAKKIAENTNQQSSPPPTKNQDGGAKPKPVSYTHLTLPTTPYV